MIPYIIYNVVHVYSLIILVYCICSWIPGAHSYGTVGKIYRGLGTIVNPYLNLFRKFIPPIGGSLDISPIVAMIVLEVIARIVLGFFF